jgi:hypothetical protein
MERKVCFSFCGMKTALLRLQFIYTRRLLFASQIRPLFPTACSDQLSSIPRTLQPPPHSTYNSDSRMVINCLVSCWSSHTNKDSLSRFSVHICLPDMFRKRYSHTCGDEGPLLPGGGGQCGALRPLSYCTVSDSRTQNCTNETSA